MYFFENFKHPRKKTILKLNGLVVPLITFCIISVVVRSVAIGLSITYIRQVALFN